MGVSHKKKLSLLDIEKWIDSQAYNLALWNILTTRNRDRNYVISGRSSSSVVV